MPTVTHPRARDDVAGHPPARVTIAGDTYPVENGAVTLPDDAAVRLMAHAYNLDAADLNQQSDADDAEALVNAGECPWCDEYEGDHVGQHASSAHPDEWDAYTED